MLFELLPITYYKLYSYNVFVLARCSINDSGVEAKFISSVADASNCVRLLSIGPEDGKAQSAARGDTKQSHHRRRTHKSSSGSAM